MELLKAMAIALRVQAALAPWCDQITIAGSIRRQAPDVGDIEIVCIPKTEEGNFDLFGKPVQVRVFGFADALYSQGDTIRGSAVAGKNIQLLLPDGIKLDLFTATPDNWGHILAIRTGCADFSQHVLGASWVKRGYRSKDGYLTKGGEIVPVPDEETLFRLLRIPYLQPWERDNTPDIRNRCSLK